MRLSEIILKAIPFESCAIQEAYNKMRRAKLKERIEIYVSEQLTAQFNGRVHNSDKNKMEESTN